MKINEIKNFSIDKSIRKWPYVFIAPYVLSYFAFGLFPVLFCLGISLTDWTGIRNIHFVGVNNYINLFTSDPYFWKSMWNTGIIQIITVPWMGVVPLLFAAILYNKNIRFSRFFQVANFVPYITTPVAIGLIFALLFQTRYGIVNSILMSLHLTSEEIGWLDQPLLARMILILIVIWRYTGYNIVIYLAGLANIPSELLEAATIDGANHTQTFLKVLIPMMRPIIIFVAITSIIGGFQVVEEPMLLFSTWVTGSEVLGGPGRACLTAVWNIYDTAFGEAMRYGKASAVAYSLFVFILAFSLIVKRLLSGRGETV